MARIDERQDEVVSGLDTVHDRVRAVNDAVAAATTLPAKVEAGIEASRPWNPYADEMAAGFGLLTVIGGLLAKRKLDATSAKYAAHKQGVERVMVGAEPIVREQMYESIAKARAANNV